jgi:hypothetical protein
MSATNSVGEFYMRRAILTTAVAVFCATALTASAAPRGNSAARTDCQPQALRDLQRLSPDGHAVYQAMTDKKLFMVFLTCEDVQLGLSTAVHESVHILTSDKDAYPLIGGGAVRRPHEVSKFYAPKEIAKRFDRSDMYVQTYLRPGAASSADDFMYLLDELNAYSHDIHSAVKLVSLHKGGGQVPHRDGLSALMTFVMGYVDTARQQHPTTWQGLQRPEVKKVVQTLWSQAETALAASCGLPGFGSKDRTYVGFLCSRQNAGALGELLGRAPACASPCLPTGTALN